MSNEQTNHVKFLPVWLWLIVLAQIVLVLFFSIGTAMNPGQFIPNVTELDYVTQLYITRNITVALGLIMALMLKSHRALLVVLAIRFLTDVSDIVSVYMLNVEVIKDSVPMVVALLVIPALVAMVYLWNRVKAP